MSIRQKIRLYKKEFSVALIVAFLVLILMVLDISLVADILWIYVLTSVSVLFFVLGIRSRYSLPLKLLSVFILLHLVVFPMIYALIINYNDKAFEVDETVEAYEVINAAREISEKYDIDNIENCEIVIENLLNSSSPILDSSFIGLNKNDVLFIDDYVLHKSFIEMKGAGGPNYFSISVLAICDKGGNNLCDIKGDLGNSISDVSIRVFLKLKLESLNEASYTLKMEEDKIRNRKIWTYRRIISYSINIFETGNLKPKNKLSNIVYFIHRFLVYGFIFGLMGSTFIEVYKTKTKP